MSDEPAGGSAPSPDTSATTRIPVSSGGQSDMVADDLQPDVVADDLQPDVPDPGRTTELAADNGTAQTPVSGRPPADYGGDPTREPLRVRPAA